MFAPLIIRYFPRLNDCFFLFLLPFVPVQVSSLAHLAGVQVLDVFLGLQLQIVHKALSWNSELGVASTRVTL